MKSLHSSLPTTELHVHRSIPPFTHLCALTLGLNTSKHLTHCSPVVVGTFVPALRSRFGDQSRCPFSAVTSANVVPASWVARSLESRSTAAHTHCHRIRCSETRKLVVTTCKQTYYRASDQTTSNWTFSVLRIHSTTRQFVHKNSRI